MAKNKTNPLAAGAAGALGGAVIGATAGAILANKKARQRVAHGIDELRSYANDAMSGVNTMIGQNPRKRFALRGVKGGQTKIKRKISEAKRK